MKVIGNYKNRENTAATNHNKNMKWEGRRSKKSSNIMHFSVGKCPFRRINDLSLKIAPW